MIDELMFADGLVPDNELQHYGVAKRSGRYPWGSGENPYHHGASSPFGRLRERRLEKKKAAAKTAQLEKARQDKIDKVEYEKKKQAALKSGSAKELMPYLRDLTDDELRIAKNRIQMEADFRGLAVKEAAVGNPKVAVAMAKAEKVTNYANTAVNAYNVAARVYNAFSKNGELPIIGSRTKRDIAEDARKKYKESVKDREQAEIRRASLRKSNAEAAKAEYELQRYKKMGNKFFEEEVRRRAKKEYGNKK